MAVCLTWNCYGLNNIAEAMNMPLVFAWLIFSLMQQHRSRNNILSKHFLMKKFNYFILYTFAEGIHPDTEVQCLCSSAGDCLTVPDLLNYDFLVSCLHHYTIAHTSPMTSCMFRAQAKCIKSFLYRSQYLNQSLSDRVSNRSFTPMASWMLIFPRYFQLLRHHYANMLYVLHKTVFL